MLYYASNKYLQLHFLTFYLGFPGGSDGKASVYNAEDPGSIPGSGRYPGEGNGNPLQYSCLENSMAGGAWWATVHGVAKSQTRLSDLTSLSGICHCSFWIQSYHELIMKLFLGVFVRELIYLSFTYLPIYLSIILI